MLYHAEFKRVTYRPVVIAMPTDAVLGDTVFDVKNFCPDGAEVLDIKHGIS